MQKQAGNKISVKQRAWLLFFYSVPSKPVSNRMKIWRKLAKAGALQFKGAVYMLPMSDEHYEFFGWLVDEVEAMGGEAAFTRVDAIDSVDDRQVIELFSRRKEGEYLPVSKTVGDLETKLNSVKKGSDLKDLSYLSGEAARISKAFEEARKTDFFSSKAGGVLGKRINALFSSLKGFSGGPHKKNVSPVPQRKAEDYQAMVWVTRKRPFVDRMASAWLIRRFIDARASFRFAEEKDLTAPGKGRISFDVSGGEFTHAGELCTFEALVRAFGIKDKTVRKLAEIVHELDIKDDKYRNPETKGLEEILSGLRKAVRDDAELLEKGIAIFEMLYLSKT
ncbi:MAG: hypothetical protein EPN22_11170 [Nitrospirae bacterium]|nr:MAG: hypothetical protein EPN22_11170 [Nitrospirota bacterium]